MLIDGITLSNQFDWRNEFEWSPVAQTQDRSVTGAFLVQEQQKTYGRPIDLVGGEDAVWHDRATVAALKAKEDIVGHQFDVTLPDGQTFKCIFNRDTGAAIQARRLTRYGGTPQATTDYVIEIIRLVTVEP